MSQTLNIRNYSSLNILASTALTQDIAAGVNSIPIQNSADFIAGSVLVGAPGSPFSEVVTITAPATPGALPVVGLTKQPHNFNDQVSMLFANQIRVYSSADVYKNGTQPPDSSFALVAGGTINIDTSQKNTAFTDPVGVNGMWYKFTYYNPAIPSETNLSDSKAVQVGQVHYVSLDQIRNAAGFSNNKNITDDLIAEFRDAAEREINGALLPVYQFPLPQPTNPIIVEIAKNLAAGELVHESYSNVSVSMANEGETKSSNARHGGGSHTSLDELVNREVVLTDATFNELTIEEGHGFGGWPDATTQGLSSNDSGVSDGDSGGDEGHQFYADKVY